MPGCKIGDRAVVIEDYFRSPVTNVGTFHRVESTCACMSGWWQVKAESPCLGVVAVSPNNQALVHKCKSGDLHCAPDRCLHPIRGDKKLAATPAPNKELELQS